MRLLGFLHGVLVTMVLVLRPRPSAPRRVLALFLASLTVYLGMHQLTVLPTRSAFYFINRFEHALPLLFGPLLYLYIATATGHWLRLSAKSTLHLVPFLLMFSIVPWVGISPNGVAMLDVVQSAHGLGYAVSAARVLRHYTSRVASLGAQAEVSDRLLWLWSLVGIHGLAGLAPISCYGLAVLGTAMLPMGFLAELRVALVVHWIGAALILRPQALRDAIRYPRVRFRWGKRHKPNVD